MNTKGFTLVHALLLLMIVSIIGGSGYYVYKAQSDTKGSLNNTAQGSDSTIAISDEKKTDSSETSSQKYVNIPEWGVKVPVSDSLKDLEYKVLGKTNAFGEKQPQIKFYTTATKNLGLICDSNYQIMTMNRGKATDVPILGDGPGPENIPENTYKYIHDNKVSGLFTVRSGDYYYIPSGGGGECVADQSAATLAKINEALEAIKQALTGITKL